MKLVSGTVPVGAVVKQELSPEKHSVAVVTVSVVVALVVVAFIPVKF